MGFARRHRLTSDRPYFTRNVDSAELCRYLRGPLAKRQVSEGLSASCRGFFTIVGAAIRSSSSQMSMIPEDGAAQSPLCAVISDVPKA